MDALARRGGPDPGEVLGILSQQVADYRQNALKWLQPLTAWLAGRLQLSPAVPWLVRNSS